MNQKFYLDLAAHEGRGLSAIVALFQRHASQCVSIFNASIHDLSEKSAFEFSMMTVRSMANPST